MSQPTHDHLWPRIIELAQGHTSHEVFQPTHARSDAANNWYRRYTLTRVASPPGSATYTYETRLIRQNVPPSTWKPVVSNGTSSHWYYPLIVEERACPVYWSFSWGAEDGLTGFSHNLTVVLGLDGSLFYGLDADRFGALAPQTGNVSDVLLFLKAKLDSEEDLAFLEGLLGGDQT
jgi:hypothetical protein